MRNDTLKEEVESAMDIGLIKLSTDELCEPYEAELRELEAEYREFKARYREAKVVLRIPEAISWKSEDRRWTAEDEIRMAEARARKEERERTILAALQAGSSEESIRAKHPDLTDREFQRAFQKAEAKARQLADRAVEP